MQWSYSQKSNVGIFVSPTLTFDGHTTLTMPPKAQFIFSLLAVSTTHLCIKSELSSFICSRDKEDGLKFKKLVMTLATPPQAVI